jgi:iron complex outermembrane receptor protein
MSGSLRILSIGYVYLVCVLMCIGDEVWELEEYAVLGWRMEEPMKRTSGVRIDISEREWGEGRDALDVLRVGANLGVREYRGVGSGELALRGFGENSGMRLLILLDGMKVNAPDMGGIDWDQIALEELELVEVLRGGQTVLYGQHASGGVLRMERKRGGEDAQGGRIRLGSDGYWLGDYWQSGSLGSVGYRIGAQSKRSSGYRRASASGAESARVSFNGSLGRQIRMDARMRVGRSEAQYPGPLSYEEAMRTPRKATSEERQSSRREEVDHAIRFQGWQRWGEWEWSTGVRGSGQILDFDGTHADREHWGVRSGPRAKVGGAERFILSGVLFDVDWLELETFTDEAREYRLSDTDLRRETLGVYLFGQFKWREGLYLSGGIREEEARTHYDHSAFDPSQLQPLDPVIWDPMRPNPNYKNPPDLLGDESFVDRLRREGNAFEVSLIREIGEIGRLWIGFDRTYRYPVLDEVASYQGYQLSTALNRDLRAERGDQVEVGLHREFENGHVTLAFFSMNMEDEIIFDEQVGLNTNLEQTFRHGFEFGYAFRMGSWEFSGQWEWVDARLDSGPYKGRTIPLVPRHRWVQRANLKVAETVNLGIHITGESNRFQGNDYANSGKILNGYVLYGITGKWEMRESVYLMGRIDNVLDKRFISTGFNGSYYPGRGRQFEVSVSWKR